MADKDEFGRKLGITNIAYLGLVIGLRKLFVLTTFISLGIIIVRTKAANYKMEFLFGLLLAYLFN